LSVVVFFVAYELCKKYKFEISPFLQTFLNA